MQKNKKKPIKKKMKRKMKKRLCILLLITVLVITGSKIVSTMTKAHLRNVQTEVDNTKVAKIENKETATLNPGRFLVNRNNTLSKDFVPKSLKIPYVQFISYVDPTVKEMDTVAATALENMFNAAEAKGINLLAVSGYRDYSYQEKLYNAEPYDSKLVAKPGASEHQTGLAMDVLSNEYSTLDEDFDKTQGFKWLENNCYKYGFIIRYPKGKEDITGYNYEPWHMRYVGVDEATEISQKHITLEEYLGSF